MADGKIDTGGGAAIENDVSINEGDFVGRDKNIYAGLTTREMFRLRIVRSYEKLWALMEPLALYSRPEPVTYEVVNSLSAAMRYWYFQEAGGLYMLQLSLDTPTRKAYFVLQELLRDVMESADDWQSESELEKSRTDEIQRTTSKLRHTIAEELNQYLMQEE